MAGRRDEEMRRAYEAAMRLASQDYNDMLHKQRLNRIRQEMGYDQFNYANGLYNAKNQSPPPQKSKRERAADLINEGRRLAREVLEEENKQAAMIKEYGPPVK